MCWRSQLELCVFYVGFPSVQETVLGDGAASGGGGWGMEKFLSKYQ